MPALGANIPKIYAYKFLSDFLVLVPVIVPFYKSYGLTVTQFMTLALSRAKISPKNDPLST